MKIIKLEWRRLTQGGKTCDRCSDTGWEVRRAASELRKLGWEVLLEEIPLDEESLDQSNIILINGVPIEEILPGAQKSESCCASCGEMLGAPVMCRTVQYNGTTHEAIPASMIMEAAALCKEEFSE
ncbi:protein of unknown function [Desulfatibacillum alkenivorans DSM 16219]|jgi:hypothetical protein|uniref:Molybdenum cofactor biosysynthesis protein n=1 Tax=Desulfatibacillum alkenivorans DSM 16219 TaxID=1121393 RepID=A0A1M6EGP0_9BACT|nr:DUF2703 domain-containing protein [Desulfatibacillum alkenivorans]SHI84458.1 protein of unknown function [Desulfatibacillum alkenivorans DSM 16219]